MYYNMYEEYIRNVLGYPKRQDIYQNDISYGIWIQKWLSKFTNK